MCIYYGHWMQFFQYLPKSGKNTHVLVETLIIFRVLCLTTVSDKINDLDSCAYDYVPSVNYVIVTHLPNRLTIVAAPTITIRLFGHF